MSTVTIGKLKTTHQLDGSYEGKVDRVVSGVELRTACGKPGPFKVVDKEVTCKKCNPSSTGEE